MLLALVIGILLSSIAKQPILQAGTSFSVKTLLRWSVALLGLRIALSDITGLGLSTAVFVILTMVLTLLAAFVLARWNGQQPGFGALVGAAVAICGASAALAASAVVPNYPTKQTDLVFVVMGANALATIAMVIYPQLGLFLGFDSASTGVLLGSTIHDMAQVVASGYAVSDEVGITAVIVKMFRVLLLLPVVLAIGYYFKHVTPQLEQAKVPVPTFAVVFIALCILNSAIPLIPQILPIYIPAKNLCVEVSTWGLLIAVSALGLSTSVSAVVGLGWRHIATMTYVTIFLAVVAVAGLSAQQLL
jgi:uncharacterized integral membrane protein (TIGR00698 family)